MRKKLISAGIFLLCLSGIYGASAAPDDTQKNRGLDLHSAVNIAIAHDPWLAGNKHSQDAIETMSHVAGNLPDPKVSLDMANLPTSNFDFGQEPMSQFKVGLSQAFPPGDSRNLKRQQLRYKSAAFPFLRQDRKAKIAVTVGQLWLDIYLARESISLIEENRGLFDQLAELAESSYTTASGKGRQHNVIRAQLEITRLEDRLTLLYQRQDMFRASLFEWLNGAFSNHYAAPETQAEPPNKVRYTLARNLPAIPLLKPQFYTQASSTDTQPLFYELSSHPSLRALEQKIKESETGIDLARQKYKPEWAIRAGYGYRATDPMGNNRADLFSLGVTFSVPLFTSSRQDKEVQAAQSAMSATKTEKWQLVRKLMAAFETEKSRLMRLNQRQTLYKSQLLPQIQEQAEASLTAYTNDDGSFSEAVRARISQIDAQIDDLTIKVERQKTILQLNYFFQADNAPLIPHDRSGDMP